MSMGTQTTYTAGNGQQMTPAQWAASPEGQKYGGVYPGLNVLQAAGGSAGASSSGPGPGTVNNAGALTFANDIMTAATDPQNATYNQTLQQVTDQSRANEMAAGLGTSGVGVGVENQAINNFNTNWQNNQLSRETQGASAYTGLLNSAQGIAQSGFTNSGTLGASAYQAPQPTLPYGTNYGPTQSAVAPVSNLFGSTWDSGVADASYLTPSGWSSTPYSGTQSYDMGSGIWS